MLVLFRLFSTLLFTVFWFIRLLPGLGETEATSDLAEATGEIAAREGEEEREEREELGEGGGGGGDSEEQTEAAEGEGESEGEGEEDRTEPAAEALFEFAPPKFMLAVCVASVPGKSKRRSAEIEASKSIAVVLDCFFICIFRRYHDSSCRS